MSLTDNGKMQLSCISSMYDPAANLNQVSSVASVPDNTQIYAFDFEMTLWWGYNTRSIYGEGLIQLPTGSVDQRANGFSGFRRTAQLGITAFESDTEVVTPDIWTIPDIIPSVRNDPTFMFKNEARNCLQGVQGVYVADWEWNSGNALGICDPAKSPLTKHDADIYLQYTSGQIGRAAVAALSPTLDCLLFCPTSRFRPWGTPSSNITVDPALKSRWENAQKAANYAQVDWHFPRDGTGLNDFFENKFLGLSGGSSGGGGSSSGGGLGPGFAIQVGAPAVPIDIDTGNNYKGEPTPKTLEQSIVAPVTAAILAGMTLIETAMGKDEVKASAILPALNSGNYHEAIGLVNTLTDSKGKPLDDTKKQEIITKMQADGIPSDDNAHLETLYNDVLTPYFDPIQTPGFADPNGIYPSIIQEASTSRLARNQNTTASIVDKKSKARATDIRTANGVEWSQPPNPYNAKYPFNHVRQTESGHIQEFDDTPGSERIHTYHKSGTYEEIDSSGTKVNRIVGDSYEILERNGNVIIRGACNVTIIGDNNIRVEQDCNIEVKGNTRLKVGGDVRAGISGNFYADVTKNFHVKCGGNYRVQAATFSVNASAIHWNTAGQDKTITTQTKFPPDLKVAPKPQFSEPKPVTKNAEILANFESPDEGDSSAFIKKKEDTKIDIPTNAESKAVEKESKAGKAATGSPITPDNSDITGCSKFTKSFPLSPNFTWGDLNQFGCANGGTQNPEYVKNLRNLAVNCLEPIYKKYPNMKLTSGFRSVVPKDGSKTSDHLTGSAADFQLTGFTRKQMYDAIIDISGLLTAYTQLLLEFTPSSCWIHVAYNSTKGNKQQKFTMNNNVPVNASSNKYTLIA